MLKSADQLSMDAVAPHGLPQRRELLFPRQAAVISRVVSTADGRTSSHFVLAIAQFASEAQPEMSLVVHGSSAWAAIREAQMEIFSIQLAPPQDVIEAVVPDRGRMGTQARMDVISRPRLIIHLEHAQPRRSFELNPVLPGEFPCQSQSPQRIPCRQAAPLEYPLQRGRGCFPIGQRAGGREIRCCRFAENQMGVAQSMHQILEARSGRTRIDGSIEGRDAPAPDFHRHDWSLH